METSTKLILALKCKPKCYPAFAWDLLLLGEKKPTKNHKPQNRRNWLL